MRKVFKDIYINIDGVDYLVAYKTKWGYVKEILVFKMCDDNTSSMIRKVKKINCKISKASTIKDWLRQLLFEIRYKFSKKSC